MAAKKTILIFIDWYLPGFKAGGPIQSCANLVSHLKGDFNFKIITRDTDYCETIPYPAVKSNAWNMIDEQTQVYYLSADCLTRREMQRLVNETAFDIAYLNGIFSFSFTIIPLFYLRKLSDKKIIVAARGMLAPGALAIKSLKKQVFLTAARVMKLFNKVTFHATSSEERKDIAQVFGNNSHIMIAGNLSKKIDLPSFHPKTKTAGTLKLINIARVAPEKNLKFALEILKDVSANIIFDFYGPVYNKSYFDECMQLLSNMPQHIKASYKEVIPNSEVPQILKNYDAMLMPTLGENFGHIILESLIASCPVIISDQTPWQQLDSDNSGRAIPLNNKDAFIAAIEMFAAADSETHNVFRLGAYQRAKKFIENTDTAAANKALFDMS
jgi:glycosyltransferase involved in cell wall biosynthesis